MKKKVLVHSLEILEQNLGSNSNQDKQPKGGAVASPSGLMTF